MIMANYKQFNSHLKHIENNWLTANGINTKTFVTDPLHLVQAQKIAHTLLQHHSQLLEQNQAATLNNFLRAAGHTQTRKQIQQRDAERIMNIGTQVNRKLFKKLRHKKQHNC